MSTKQSFTVKLDLPAGATAADAVMWENWEERVSETARKAGLTDQEVENILYGDG